MRITLMSNGSGDYDRGRGPCYIRGQPNSCRRKPTPAGPSAAARYLEQSRRQHGRRIEGNRNVPQASQDDQRPEDSPAPIFRRGRQR